MLSHALWCRLIIVDPGKAERGEITSSVIDWCVERNQQQPGPCLKIKKGKKPSREMHRKSIQGEN